MLSERSTITYRSSTPPGACSIWTITSPTDQTVIFLILLSGIVPPLGYPTQLAATAVDRRLCRLVQQAGRFNRASLAVVRRDPATGACPRSRLPLMPSWTKTQVLNSRHADILCFS
jgi:hypothetical protein